jgi:hypothetical protein
VQLLHLQSSNIVTVNKVSHALDLGEYITFTSVTIPGTSSFIDTDFTSFTFEILSVPDANSFTIQMQTTETGTPMSLQDPLV